MSPRRKTSRPLEGLLSRRERQIMDVLIRDERATAADVQARIPDAPSYSAVRALLRVLEEKGHVTHERVGPRYVYRPTATKAAVRRDAARRLLETFFEGSVSQAVASLLDAAPASDEELASLEALIERAKEEES